MKSTKTIYSSLFQSKYQTEGEDGNMDLLPADKEYLDSHGKDYTVIEMPGELHIILKNEKVSSIYDQTQIDVLIRIPQGYQVLKR